MAEYQKKPVIINAFQWTGDEKQMEDPQWIVDAIKNGDVYFKNEGTPEIELMIKTLEGEMTASRGDYIIKGVKGELYPCKPDIFEMTYDKAPENWLDRLHIEGDELCDRVEGLTKALVNKTVPKEEEEILNRQLVVMTEYLNILSERKEIAINKSK